MIYPVAELITQNVVETIQGIRLAAGFNGNLKVERYKKGGKNSNSDLTAIVGFDDDVEAGTEDTPINFQSWIRPYWVLVYIYEPSEEMPYDQRLDIVRADIAKALMQDASRGGHAQNTFIRAPIRFDPPNDTTGILVQFDVHYWHDEEDPYNYTPPE